MINYQCPRCHYIASEKYYIKRHYNRKNPCEVKYENVEIVACLKKLSKLEKPRCEYCNKSYSKKSNLTRHQKTCKDKKNKELVIKVEELKKENEKLKQNTQGNSVTNIDNSHNKTINNINNNVIVIKFDVNNLSTRIPDAEKLKCFRDKTYQAPPIEDFLKTIHFNPEYPEYHNIFKSDMNREWISMFDGTRIVKQPENFVDDIIEKVEKEIEYLIDNNEEYKEYYRGLRTHLNMMKKDEEYRESLVKGVKLLIHNNKDVPAGTLKILGVM